MQESADRQPEVSATLPLDAFSKVSKPFIAFLSGDYIAVFKPAGMNSTRVEAGGPSGIVGGPADLVSWLSAEMPDHEKKFLEENLEAGGGDAVETGGDAEEARGKALQRRLKREQGLLSRLDRDTSGLVLFARSKEVFSRSLELQSAGLIKKFYRLIASPSNADLPGFKPQRLNPSGFLAEAGFKEPQAGQSFEIAGLFRSFGYKGARVACIAPAYASETKKKLTPKTYSTKVLSFDRLVDSEEAFGPFSATVETRILSGFRHQIRAHMAWIGFPVVGDEVYGGHPASRLYLESHRIEIAPPRSDPIIIEIYDKR